MTLDVCILIFLLPSFEKVWMDGKWVLSIVHYRLKPSAYFYFYFFALKWKSLRNFSAFDLASAQEVIFPFKYFFSV